MFYVDVGEERAFCKEIIQDLNTVSLKLSEYFLLLLLGAAVALGVHQAEWELLCPSSDSLSPWHSHLTSLCKPLHLALV